MKPDPRPQEAYWRVFLSGDSTARSEVAAVPMGM